MNIASKTAIHEAGHVVANVRFGIAIGLATIIPRDNALGEATNEETLNYDEERAVQEILVLCAGYAACFACGLRESDALAGAGDDFDRAQEIIDGWKLGTLDEWKGKAYLMMLESRNLNAVCLVASKLDEHKKLFDEHIEVLIELSDGEIIEQDYLNWQVLRESL